MKVPVHQFEQNVFYKEILGFEVVDNTSVDDMSWHPGILKIITA